jgi:2-dehydro-3-deoxy-D-arabinonate dehydratase
MSRGLFRIRGADGGLRLAAGDTDRGPSALVPNDFSLDAILSGGGQSLEEAIGASGDPVGETFELEAPVQSQEIWAAGVTYVRSRDARVEEAIEPSPYDRVYAAERPELFLKTPGWRAVGAGTPIGIRADSSWNVPEPELAIVADASMRIVGYTIGNDVSSRSIEGENTLYIPQAKTYERSCALGPAIVSASDVGPPFGIAMTIVRGGVVVYDDATDTASMARSFDDLLSYLGRALAFPAGAVLLTGTGIVPDPPFTLEPGDEVRIAIDGLGTLTNTVVGVGGV